MNLFIQTVAMILVLLTFVCVFHGNLVFSNSNDELTNVAYSKSVRLSSFASRWHNGFYAVNGMFSDYIHTLVEKSPWLRIDLGARYQIHEIEVFARSDCCGKFLIYKMHTVDRGILKSLSRKKFFLQND